MHGGAPAWSTSAAKPETARRALAEAFVRLSRAACRRVRENSIDEGRRPRDRAARRHRGGQAHGRSDPALPSAAHRRRARRPRARAGRACAIRAEVRAHDRTGVEMEALTAASVAALTVYDMTKAVDRGAVIGPIRLLEKDGGKSGRVAAAGPSRSARRARRVRRSRIAPASGRSRRTGRFSPMLTVAIAGATGAVGDEFLARPRAAPLPGRPPRPPRLRAVRRASRSAFAGADHPVADLATFDFQGVDVAFFSAGADRSRDHGPRAAKAGALVVDNSSAFRMDPAVPLVVPEVNLAAVRASTGHHREPELLDDPARDGARAARCATCRSAASSSRRTRPFPAPARRGSLELVATDRGGARGPRADHRGLPRARSRRTSSPSCRRSPRAG